MNILIAGDFCQKYRIDKVIKEKHFSRLFDEVKLVTAKADYSIVNFEFPIVLNPKNAKPIPKCGPNLQGTIEAVEAIKYAGFDCCTLANNHILDQGEVCCIDTKTELEKAGIDTVGVGGNLKDAAKILYKEINGKMLAIINCCENEFSIATETSAGSNPLNPIRQYNKIQEARQHADYLLVIVHGGHELYQFPSPRMKETYRFFIDAGADAVVNHHQHCYSGYEIYNGKPIFYGLGNFLFDRTNVMHSIWNEGYMVNLSFQEQEIGYTLIPYSQCNEEPTISILKDESLNKFNSCIKELNAIISNDTELNKHHKNWMAKSFKHYKLALEPYSGRILSAMYARNLLPSCITRKKNLALLNYLECESHLDRLKFTVKEIFK